MVSLRETRAAGAPNPCTPPLTNYGYLIDENDVGPGLHFSLPAGITVEGATPRFSVSAGMSAKKPTRGVLEGGNMGVAPSTSTPSRAARRLAGRRGGGARRSLASLYRRGGGKAVSSRAPCGVSEKHRTTTARTPPSESDALWWSKSCPASVSGPAFVRRTLIPLTPYP